MTNTPTATNTPTSTSTLTPTPTPTITPTHTNTPTVTPTLPPPSAPTLLSPANGASALSTTNITLSWSSVSGAAQYSAEYAGPTSGNSGWISGASFNVGTLSAGNYTWRVKARNDGGESSWSNSFSLVVLNPSVTTINVDGSGFSLHKQSSSCCWFHVSGYKSSTVASSASGNPYFTWTRTSSDAGDIEWTVYQPNLPYTNWYRVSAYIPDYWVDDPYNQHTANAIYRIFHAGAWTDVSVSQIANHRQWVDLGRLWFDAGASGYVHLGDNTGEYPNVRLIAADSIRFVLEP